MTHYATLPLWKKVLQTAAVAIPVGAALVYAAPALGLGAGVGAIVKGAAVGAAAGYWNNATYNRLESLHEETAEIPTLGPEMRQHWDKERRKKSFFGTLMGAVFGGIVSGFLSIFFGSSATASPAEQVPQQPPSQPVPQPLRFDRVYASEVLTLNNRGGFWRNILDGSRYIGLSNSQAENMYANLLENKTKEVVALIQELGKDANPPTSFTRPQVRAMLSNNQGDGIWENLPNLENVPRVKFNRFLDSLKSLAQQTNITVNWSGVSITDNIYNLARLK